MAADDHPVLHDPRLHFPFAVPMNTTSTAAKLDIIVSIDRQGHRHHGTDSSTYVAVDAKISLVLAVVQKRRRIPSAAVMPKVVYIRSKVAGMWYNARIAKTGYSVATSMRMSLPAHLRKLMNFDCL